MVQNNDYSYCNAVGQTDIGRKRKANEDHGGHFVTVNGLVSVVCDGMGGHVGGAVASELAVGAIHEFLSGQYFDDPREAIGLAIDAANRAIIRRAEAEPSLIGMGSTCVLLIVRNGLVYIGHVGDSRIYLVREKNIVQLTKDHSFVQSLVDMGELTPEQAEHHPRKNEITNALGIPNMAPATVRSEAIEPQSGDCFLLCSDGLSGMVDSSHIEKIVSRQREFSTQQRADLLVQAANNNGGVDNITVELVEFSVTPGKASSSKFSGCRINKPVVIGIVAAVAVLALAAFFVFRPRTRTVIYKSLADVEFTAGAIVYELVIKDENGLTSIKSNHDNEKLTDKTVSSLAGTDLEIKNLGKGRYELSFPNDFRSDSLHFSIAGKDFLYSYAAKVIRQVSVQKNTLPGVLFKSNAEIATIINDSRSLRIMIEGREDEDVIVPGAIEKLEISPREAIAKTKDQKTILKFPRKKSFDEIVISFVCDGAPCEYVIPVLTEAVRGGGNGDGSGAGKIPIIDQISNPRQGGSADVAPKPVDNGSAVVGEDSKPVDNGGAPAAGSDAEAAGGSSNAEASDGEAPGNNDANAVKFEVATDISIAISIGVDSPGDILIINGTDLSYNCCGNIGKLRSFSGIDANGISFSPPSSVSLYKGDDKYVFSVKEKKSGDSFVITVPGTNGDGKSQKAIFTITVQ